MSLRRGQYWRHRHILSQTGGGGGGPPPPPPPATGTAFSYDVLTDASTGAPNAARTLTIVPRGGNWPATGQITLAANNSTFSSATVTPTPGSTTSVVTTVTPTSAAEIIITATNTGGLIDPTARRMNALVTSNGTAGVITSAVQLGGNPEWHHYAREIYIGNPTGFSTGFNKGWAPVQISLNPAINSGALYARLYDADSAGASATVGTGTLVQDWVQVYGAVIPGVHTITPLLPAGPDWWYVDLALDVAGTNPIRLNKRLGVGDHTYVETRSNQCGIMNSYPQGDSATQPADLSVIVNYKKTATFMSGAADFVRQDGNTVGQPNLTTTGAMEFGRIMAGRTGVTQALLGRAITGGNYPDHLHPNCPWLITYPTTDPLDALGIGTRPSYFLFEVSGLPAATTASDPSSAQHVRMITNLMANMRKKWPGAWIGVGTSAVGFGLYDGSNPDHWGREAQNWFKTFETGPDAVIVCNDTSNSIGMFSNSGHADHMTKIEQARAWARFALSAQTQERGGSSTRGQRGPVPGSTGTWVSDYVVEIPFTHNGGTSLSALKSIQDNFGSWTSMTTFTFATATAREATQLVAIRLAGNMYTRGRPDSRAPTGATYAYQAPGVAVQLSGVTIDNTRNVLVCTLDSTSASNIKFIDGSTMSLATAKTLGFSAYVGVDTAYENNTTLYAQGLSFVDDQSADGVPYGFPMRYGFDIYVAPTTPPTQALGAIAAIATSSPGDWVKITSAAGTGLWASAPFTVKIDGSAVTTYDLRTYQDNSWSAWLRLSSSLSVGSHTVGVYRSGQSTPDTTGTLNVQARSTLLGIPGSADARYIGLSTGGAASCAFWWSGRHADMQFTDVAASTPVTANLQDVRCWQDAIGGNKWTQAGNVTVGAVTSTAAPAIDITASCGEDWSTTPKKYMVNYAPAITFETFAQKVTLAAGAPLLSRFGGDFTIALTYFAPNTFGTTNPVLQFAGTNGGIQIYDSFGHTHFARGLDDIDWFAVTGRNLQLCGLGKIVMRYRASDDFLEVFRAGNAVLSIAAASATKTGTAAAMTITSGLIGPGWSSYWDIIGFDTRLSDADKDALIAWQNAVTVA
jgi:hypothetical protein